MKKLNRLAALGMLCIGITLILKYVLGLPEAVSGVGIGIGIGLELIGVLTMNHKTSKIREFKMALFKKIFS